MKKAIVLFIPLLLLYAPTITFYSDWDWGYYYWLFGPIGPVHSDGMAAAGYSTLEYRGYNQFSLGGYPGNIQINSLVLRLRNNTGGAGLQIDINRVFSDTPGWDECGNTAPIYLTNQSVSPDAENYTYFDLTSTQAQSDFIDAWQNSSWFGFGYKGSRGSGEPTMHFFYAWWADEILDAALIVDYVIVGIDEQTGVVLSEPGLYISPNPFNRMTNLYLENTRPEDRASLKIFNAVGKLVRCFSCTNQYLNWYGRDAKGNLLPKGVYFVHLEINGELYEIQKVVLMR
jgi:hypothetical protein